MNAHSYPAAAMRPDRDSLTAIIEELRMSLTAASLTLRCVEIGAADSNLVTHTAESCERTLLHLRSFALGLK